MAKILQPKLVVRLDPNDRANKISNWGFKWHLPTKRSDDGKPTRSACGIVLEPFTLESAMFSMLKGKDMCAVCFKGLEISDG